MHKMNGYNKNTGIRIGKNAFAAFAHGLHGLPQYVLLCCLCCLGASHLTKAAVTNNTTPRWAQLADPVFTHIGVEQGLPHGIVTALAEDASGFIWVGTQGGLARWDGYRFRVYQPNPKDAGSLPDNYIHVLHTDRRGQLWVGTNSGGLARYDAMHDRFIRIGVASDNHADGVSHATIQAIADDGSDGLWVGTRGGLDHILANGSIKHLRQGDNTPASNQRNLPSEQISSLLRDQAGRLWVGTDKGLAVQDGKSERFIAVVLPTAPDPEPAIWRLMQSVDGKIWVSTTQHGVFVLDTVNGSAVGPASPLLETDGKGAMRSDLHSAGGGSGFASQYINAIVEARPGEIWIGSYGKGVVLVNSATLKTHRILRDAALPTGLPNDAVYVIMKSRAGLVWVGTERGLGLHDAGQTAALSLFGDPTRVGRITNADITSASTMPDGSIWLGLKGGGVNIIDAAARQVAWLAADASQPESALPTVPVQAVVLAKNDTVSTIYIGTERGLYRRDLNGRQVQRLVLPARDPVKPVFSLLADDATLWLGGNDGLWRIEVADSAAQGLRPPNTSLLEKQIVLTLARANDGALWIGTQSGGLYRYDPRSHALLHIAANASAPTGLSHDTIGSLLFDHQGRLWIATQGGGINMLATPSAKAIGSFRRIGMQQGLPNDNVNKLLEDAQGRIWASTDSGLAVIDPNTFAVSALGRADGIAIAAYWNNSGTRTAQDELLFGGIGGLTVVRPERLKRWNYLPPMVVTDLQLGGQAVRYSQLNQLASAGFSRPMLTISPNANSIAVEFSALDYSAPQQNRYAYRLDGYDKDWISTDWTRRLAAYTNLPPGDYQLRLRGSNRNGVWTTQEMRLPLRVLPAWYQTWWFRLIEVMAAAAAVFALVQGRTGYLLRRKKELELEVQQRTVELRQSNTALSDANVGLALSVDTLRQLGDIGRDITANLDAEVVFESLHQYVGGLMDASTLTIYRVNLEADGLEMVFGRQDGRVLAQPLVPLDSPLSFAARAVREQQDLLIDFGPDQPMPLPLPDTRRMSTAMFSPLIVDSRVLGVLSIQSGLEHAYGERERLIFRTLSAYGAIALANAESLAQVQQRTVQLHESNTALNEANAGLALSVETLRQLGDIGRDITANLDAEIVFQSLYQYMGGLLDVSTFSIYRMNPAATALDRLFGREDGQVLPVRRIALDSPTSNAARAVRERQDLLLEFALNDDLASIVPGTRDMQSAMFSPLIVDGRVLGVLTIQSDQAQAYGERERLIFRTLSAYGAIALANAESLAALHQAQAQLVQQEKMASLGGLVAGVAHEINTPLGTTMMALSGASDTWQRLRETVATGRISKTVLDSSTQEGIEYTDLALKTATRVAALIATFKTIAVHTESDRRIDLDLAAYLSEVATVIRAPLIQNDHSITIEVEPGLTLHTVPDALTEALTRILSNVLDHGFAEVKAGVLHISAKADSLNEAGVAESVVISISDNGAGIAAPDLPKVFDPFFTTKSGIGGHVGLGLHVAFNHITQRLKGKISIASTQGEGTTVTICLNNA